MPNKPDIIVINPDQMRADALHHLGNKASYTPNIDALIKFKISPLIKGVMKISGKDFKSLVDAGMKLFKIDTNKFYKK